MEQTGSFNLLMALDCRWLMAYRLWTWDYVGLSSTVAPPYKYLLIYSPITDWIIEAPPGWLKLVRSHSIFLKNTYR